MEAEHQFIPSPSPSLAAQETRPPKNREGSIMCLTKQGSKLAGLPKSHGTINAFTRTHMELGGSAKKQSVIFSATATA